MFCKTELFLFCSSSSLQMGARPFFSPELPTGAVPCTAGRLHQGSWKTLLPSALILHINLWLPGSGNQADCWFALGEVQLHECEHSSRVCIPERPAQRWKDGTKGLFAPRLCCTTCQCHGTPANQHSPLLIALKIKWNQLVLHILLQQGAEMVNESYSRPSSALQQLMLHLQFLPQQMAGSTCLIYKIT